MKTEEEPVLEPYRVNARAWLIDEFGQEAKDLCVEVEESLYASEREKVKQNNGAIKTEEADGENVGDTIPGYYARRLRKMMFGDNYGKEALLTGSVTAREFVSRSDVDFTA